jgi:hypothetical protein
MKWHDDTLTPSDRLVTRQEESEAYLVNKAANPRVALWRGEVYVATEERLLQIDNATTFDELKALGSMPVMDEQPIAWVND